MPIQYIPQDPYDPMGLGLGQGIAQGLSRFANQWTLGKDMNALQLWAASQLPQGQAGPQMGFPTMGHPMMQQMAAQNMMGNIFRDPLETLEALKLQRDIAKPYYQPGIIENAQTGDQRPYNYGDPIPPGWKIVKEAQTVVNVGTQPASPTERKEIAETRASIDALNNLKTLFDSAQTTTGVIAGRVSPTAGLFGFTSDEQEAFMAATSAFKNAIIKEITGAQMSEVEARRIMKQVPDITDPPKRWLAKWQQSKKNLEFLQKRRSEVLRQSGLKVPEGEIKIDRIIPDEVINNMSLEEVEKALAKIEGNTTLTPDLTKPKTSLEKGMVQQQNQMAQVDFQVSESEMRQIINELPAPLKSKINKLSATHRSRVWQRLGNLGIENWNILTPKQKTQTVMRIINETRK